MPKWLTALLLLACLLVLPLPARAQTDNITLAFVDVQIWPEYDRPDALVIYDFSVSQDTPLPATLTLRMPADADVLAVAVLQGDTFLNVEYNPPTSDGQWLLISLQVTDRSTYRVEYYAPLNKSGQTRQFTYNWQGDYAVQAFSISVQQPVDAGVVTTDPIVTTPLRGNDGFTYYTTETNMVPAGQPFSLNIRYDKSTDTLSAQSLQVQPSGGELIPDQPANWTNYLPAILGGAGVLLIVGGGLWYWQSGRGGEQTIKRRKRHAAPEVEESGGGVYCHQCGKRAGAGDRFCRACGSKLRLQE